MNIKLQVAEKQYKFLQDCDKRNIVLYGGADSAKSWSVAQYLIFENLLKRKAYRLLVTRKTRPALKRSCWQLMNDLLTTYEIPYEANKSDLIITVNNNQIFFAPCDEPKKLKSIEGICDIWAEEANELTQNDILEIQKLPRKGKNNRIYMTFNPSGDHEYLKRVTSNPPADTAVLHCTYHDNPFLPPARAAVLEGYREIDQAFYNIYAQGIWAELKGVIYREGINWDIVQDWDPARGGLHGYGLDFGYTNSPTALLEMYVSGNEIWERELLYETGLTNSDISRGLFALGVKPTSIIIADAAEPKSIDEIHLDGWNIHPCEKGKDSVNNGISLVKQYTRHVHCDSVNLIREDRNYKWREDKGGKLLNAPAPLFDHLKDAERYVLKALCGIVPDNGQGERVIEILNDLCVPIGGGIDNNYDDIY